MTRLHGRDWWVRARTPRGRLPFHLVVTAAGLTALGCAVAGRSGPALLCAGVWLGATAEFTLARVLPGPRTRPEVAVMTVTGVLIPPAACWHWPRGRIRHRRPGPWPVEHAVG